MLTINAFKKTDLNEIIESFIKIKWHKPKSLFLNYLEEQNLKERYIWIARIDNLFAGYITLKINSEYKSFKNQNIPEVNDFNVLPVFWRRGIGSKLLLKVEDFCKAHRYKEVGLGVGLSRDYGAAQKMYFKFGYIPDGMGITYDEKYVKFGSNVKLDDSLVKIMDKSKTYPLS